MFGAGAGFGFELGRTSPVVYGILAAYVFGFLMNPWFWPSTTGVGE